MSLQHSGGSRAVVDERKLIQRFLQGDQRAFGELVRPHEDRLRNAVRHVVGCPEEARDIVQEALVRAFLKLDQFQQDSSFYTWLYRIAFNLALTRRRRGSRAEQAAPNEVPEPADPGEAPADRLLRLERAELVQAALGMLSQEHRAVLVLREFENCDYRTIADILEITVPAVRNRLYRAREQLRAALRQIAGPSWWEDQRV